MDGGSQICDGPTSRQPAGQPNLEKMAARAPQGGPGPAAIFSKFYWPAGWPITYLASPIHFGGILLVFVYYWIYFSYYGWKCIKNQLILTNSLFFC